jgi:serine/threonine protein kinase
MRVSKLRERYRIGARIGGGGMAEVLEATVLGADGFARPVAVKRMLPALTSNAAFGEMFRSEAHLASLLHHPNIASVLDFDRDEDGSYFIVMELVRGLDLRQLTQSGPIPVAVSAFIIGEVLAGLAYAHELLRDGHHLGIVHRDISPHNVMISWDGAVKVVDFGIAKAVAATNASGAGSLKGKVSYMSPEQASGHPLDGRSDLFAVGVMFHELLTGRRLFSGGTDPEILSRLLHQPIPSPQHIRADVPADLAAVAMRLLERDRRARYRSARATLDALLGCASTTARGRLDLQALLRERFPDSVPRIPTAVRGGDSVAPRPVPSAARATPAALGSTFTGDYGVAPTLTSEPTPTTRPTPTGAGQQTTSGARGSTLWILGGAGFMVAAAVILLVALSGAREAPTDPVAVAATASAAADAGAIDAADVPHISAPPDAAVLEPDAAPTAPKTSRRSPSTKKKQKEPVATGAPGKLRISVVPWARVKIGGMDRGEAPTTLTLMPGTYEVELTNDALGKRETLTIEVESDRTARIVRTWQQ